MPDQASDKWLLLPRVLAKREGSALWLTSVNSRAEQTATPAPSSWSGVLRNRGQEKPGQQFASLGRLGLPACFQFRKNHPPTYRKVLEPTERGEEEKDRGRRIRRRSIAQVAWTNHGLCTGIFLPGRPVLSVRGHPSAVTARTSYSSYSC